MASERCEICGKPPSGYPNWCIGKGHAYHVGCVVDAYDRLAGTGKDADKRNTAASKPQREIPTGSAPAPREAGAILTREDFRYDAEHGCVDKLLAHDAALRAEVERVTDVAYAHCSRADAREADIERITAHYAGAMELANRKVSLMTELLRRAVPLVAFCAPKDSTLGEEIRRAIHE